MASRNRHRLLMLAFAAAAIGLAGCPSGPRGSSPGGKPKAHIPAVTLTITRAVAQRTDFEGGKRKEDLWIWCDVVATNNSGSPLEVKSHFYSAFDGLGVVGMTKDGRKLFKQWYVFHQSPASPEPRIFPLPVGKTSKELSFPFCSVPPGVKEIKVQIVGGFPGTRYDKGLASNVVDVRVEDEWRWPNPPDRRRGTP